MAITWLVNNLKWNHYIERWTLKTEHACSSDMIKISGSMYCNYDWKNWINNMRKKESPILLSNEQIKTNWK